MIHIKKKKILKKSKFPALAPIAPLKSPQEALPRGRDPVPLCLRPAPQVLGATAGQQGGLVRVEQKSERLPHPEVTSVGRQWPGQAWTCTCEVPPEPGEISEGPKPQLTRWEALHTYSGALFFPSRKLREEPPGQQG